MKSLMQWQSDHAAQSNQKNPEPKAVQLPSFILDLISKKH
ncbi:hypothetical protein R2APBS1_1664 [Rhodanobacter denitrificans]|uniref:Uncharacterized protein n=1 Tax=Rhodanobacter denitrificans TaxID=666685 RepID=M4NM36_9GAMM|nr:hypothetical protein R2APBS1_1664 [Rhodanobacter denitrificans]